MASSHEDRRRVTIRLSILQGLITVLFSVLAVSFWVLQVVQNAKFEEMAENNHQRTLALRAPRGIVFDRDLKVLVVVVYVALISGPATGLLTGTFAGIADNQLVTFSGYSFTADYTPTGEFDLIAVPEPSTWIAGGLTFAASLTDQQRGEC